MADAEEQPKFYANQSRRLLVRRTGGEVATLTEEGWRRTNLLIPEALGASESEDEDEGMGDEEQDAHTDGRWRELRPANAELRVRRLFSEVDLQATALPAHRWLARKLRGLLRWVGYSNSLPWGSPRRLDERRKRAAYDSYASKLTGLDGPDLEHRIEEAREGYDGERARTDSVESRAALFVGATGLTSSILIANVALIADSGLLASSGLRVPAVLALATASTCAAIAGFLSLQAIMVPFHRAKPNSRPRITSRVSLTGSPGRRHLLACYLVAQRRTALIGDWKLERFKAARFWFYGVLLSVMAVAAMVLVSVL